MLNGVFVTGTDTEVGKTVVTTGLIQGLVNRGIRTIGLKPVVAGVSSLDSGLVWEDLEAIKAAGGEDIPSDIRAPYRFERPCSPDIAARAENVEIEIGRISQSVDWASSHADCVVVEGVGGFLVPLGPNLDVADMARTLRFPVLLVVGIRLGCINHALLTMEAIRQRGVPSLGWVANLVDPAFAYQDDSIASIAHREGPPLARLPYLGVRSLSERGRLSTPFLADVVDRLIPEG